MRSKNNSKNELVKAILEEYQPETAEDVQNALKDIFGPMFEAMLQGEMNAHLGYNNNSKEAKKRISKLLNNKTLEITIKIKD